MKRAFWWAVIFGLGCASTSNREGTIPEAGRARWSACRQAIETYCHNLGHGDPMTESQCERDTISQYAALTTDEARAQYLTSHGCRATP